MGSSACLRCAKVFSFSGNRARRFCGHSCANLARSSAETRQCEGCGNSFRSTADYAGKKPQRFCSSACWRAAVSVPERACLACAVVFKPVTRSTVYCCQSCRDDHYRTRMAGDASHRWMGGRTAANKLLRTSAAYSEWRESVFRRDNWTCVKCGARSCAGGPVELHADHELPLSERPDLALDITNGRTLCAPCHRSTDTWGVKQAQRMRSIAVTGEEFPS